jgi:hypothetical protein
VQSTIAETTKLSVVITVVGIVRASVAAAAVYFEAVNREFQSPQVLELAQLAGDAPSQLISGGEKGLKAE